MNSILCVLLGTVGGLAALVGEQVYVGWRRKRLAKAELKTIMTAAKEEEEE
jgi:hypothetical protein